MRFRPWWIAPPFALILAIVVNLAWLTAVGTDGPWYSAAVSLQTYSVAVVAGFLLAIALAAIGAMQGARLDEQLLETDLHFRLLQRAANGDSRVSAAEERGAAESVDDLEAILGRGLAAAVSHSVGGGGRAIVTVPTNAPAPGLARELAEQRELLRAARAMIWKVLAGPALASVVLAGIAGAMLPGSEGFAFANFRLNTTLVLVMAYGLPFVAIWAIAAIAVANGFLAHRILADEVRSR